MDEHVKTVFLVGGGTGGHVFPMLALTEELLSRGVRVECITDKRGQKYFGNTNLMPNIVSSSAWAKDWPGRFMAALKIIRGLIESFELLREYSPGVVVGFGGYPCFPTVKAAQLLKICTVLHEQNAVFGRANRKLAKMAAQIAVSFRDTKSLPLEGKNKVVHTGNPIRTMFLSDDVSYQAPASGQPIHLLIFGGSQGSALFSQVVPEAIGKLPPEFKARLVVIQQARAEDLVAVKDAYKAMNVRAKIQSFFSDMPQQYEAAHLVIARAGASTVTELAVTGRPAIFVPLAASLDGDQAQNAQAFVAQQAGWMIDEASFNATELARRLIDILANPAQLDKAAKAAQKLAKRDATQALADLVMKKL